MREEPRFIAIFKAVESLSELARCGYRVTRFVEGGKEKTLWAGLGNRSGLHSYADELLSEKWSKSGERFVKKLRKLESGSLVFVYRYRAINRDRGRWVKVETFTL